MKQIPLAIGPEPARTFENFLPGANAAALAHLLALRPARRRSTSGAPPAAARRTCCTRSSHRAQERGESTAWFDADRRRRGRLPEHCGWLVLDDCDALDAPQQHAAFALFVEATDRGAVVLAAGRLPPVDLDVREDLRTRLGWGHVFALAAAGRARGARGAAPRGRPARHLPVRRGDGLPADPLRARPEAPDGASSTGSTSSRSSTKRAITVPLLKQMLAEESDARDVATSRLFDLDRHAAADRLRPRLGRVHDRARLGRRAPPSRAATTRSTPSTRPAALDIARLHRLRHGAAARARAGASSPRRTRASCAR